MEHKLVVKGERSEVRRKHPYGSILVVLLRQILNNCHGGSRHGKGPASFTCKLGQR